MVHCKTKDNDYQMSSNATLITATTIARIRFELSAKWTVKVRSLVVVVVVSTVTTRNEFDP